MPSTKRTVISERADFDERYFPGLKKNNLDALPNVYYPPAPPLNSVELPDLGGDNMPLPVAPLAPPDAVQAPAPPPNEPEIPEIPEPQEVERSPSPEIPVEPLLPQQPVQPQLPRHSTRLHNPPGEWWKVRNPPPPVPDESDDELAELVDPDCANGFQEAEFVNLAGGTEPRNLFSGNERSRCRTLEEDCNRGDKMLICRMALGRLSDFHLARKQLALDGVWKVKLRANGSIEHYKGRFVAKRLFPASWF